jgi:hypothetical protein
VGAEEYSLLVGAGEDTDYSDWTGMNNKHCSRKGHRVEYQDTKKENTLWSTPPQAGQDEFDCNRATTDGAGRSRCKEAVNDQGEVLRMCAYLSRSKIKFGTLRVTGVGRQATAIMATKLSRHDLSPCFPVLQTLLLYGVPWILRGA